MSRLPPALPTPRRSSPLFLITFGCACLLALPMPGADPPAGATSSKSSSDDTVQLSPFLVSTAGDEGYRAANTLSGTRMNASLFQTPAAISVLTKEFLDDIGAENVGDMFKFAISADSERTDQAGGLGQAFDIRATIRGFTESIITRDYLPNMIQSRGILASDRFNIERADVSRGPNSILYGASRPGGAFNVSSKRAVLNGRQKSATTTIGSFRKFRSEVDLAFPLLRDRLALRTNGVWDTRGGWFEHESVLQQAAAAAVTYQPFRHTQVRAGVERLRRSQVIAGQFPHADFGYSRWVKGGSPLAPNPLLPGTNPAPTLLRSINTLQAIFAPQVRPQAFRLSTTGADMRPDLTGNQPTGFWETISGPAAPSAGTVDDPFYGQVIPAKAYLAGPGRSASYNYTLASAFIDQRIGGLSIELGYAYTRYFRGFTQPNVNAVGDPNPVLPGAYFADGDSVIAAGRLPGTLLPDIGRTNPFVGLPYVQAQTVQQHFDQRNEAVRASLGYTFDLTKRHAWFGRHAVAASWQRDKNLFGNGVIAEYNLAPNNAQPIDSATNIILRRTWLDFSSPGGPRGALDPWKYPIPESPGMKAGFAWNNSYPWTTTAGASAMAALQSRFPRDRIVLTSGYRRDRVEVNDATGGGEPWPGSTNLWRTRPYRFVDDTITVFHGTTRTYGAVVTPLSWLGLASNRSESTFPQGNFKNIYARVLDPIAGTGHDYSVRFNLLGGRLGASVNQYRAIGANQFQPALNAPKNSVVNAANSALNTLRARGLPLPKIVADAGLTLLSTDSRDSSDFVGRGTEFEITGRLARGWNLSLNYARNNLEQSNIAADVNHFLAAVKPEWERNATRLDDTPAAVATFVRTRDATPSRDFVANPATLADVYGYALSVMAPFNRGTGKAPFTHVARTGNAFTSYRFADEAPSVLRRARLGLGANYRGPAVIGYDSAHDDAVILGRSAIIWNAMLGKHFPLIHGRALDLQLNIENLFQNEDLLPYSAASPGNVVRYILPRVRQTWNLRTTFTF